MFYLTLTQQEAHLKRISRIYCGGKQKRQRSDKMDEVYFQLRASRSKSIKDPQQTPRLEKKIQMGQSFQDLEINKSAIGTVLNSSPCNIVCKNRNLVIKERPNKFYYNKNDSLRLLKDYSLQRDKSKEKLKGILYQEKCKIYQNPYGLGEKQTSFKDNSIKESEKSHLQLPHLQQFIEGQTSPRLMQTKSFKKSTQDLFYQKYD